MKVSMFVICLVANAVLQLAEGGRVRRDIETAKQLVGVLDEDRDGFLNEQEANTDIQAEEPFYFRVASNSASFQYIDRNRDGKLSAEEIEASAGEVLNRLRKRKELLEEVKRMMRH